MERFLDRLAHAILVLFGAFVVTVCVCGLWISYGWAGLVIPAVMALLAWASLRVLRYRDRV